MKIIRRDYTTKAETGNDGTIRVVASTDTSDRYDDVIEQDFDLSRFRANPVIAFAHRYDIPVIGKATDVSIEKGKLVATIKFDDSEENPLGRTVAHQMREGYLNSVSVGFNPGTVTPRSKLSKEHPAHAERGLFMEGPHELLEISVTPIPANPEALALRAFGVPSVHRHILDVEETDDAWIVSYAKGDGPPEEAEAEEEAEPEETEAGADEVFGYDDDDDDDEEKAASPRATRAADSYLAAAAPPAEPETLRAEVRRALIELLGSEPEILEPRAEEPDPIVTIFGLTN